MQENWIDQHLKASTFYQTDLISENSSAMAKTQNEFINSPILKRIHEGTEDVAQPQAIGK